jgi:dCTP deaminase
MLLSDKQIHRLLQQKELFLVGTRKDNPFNPTEQVRPASIDLRLGARISFLDPPNGTFDTRDDPTRFTHAKYLDIGEPYSVPPNGIVFGQIYEQMRLPEGVAGIIIGRSRTARAGISVNATGGYINPGFRGAMPLQILNHNVFPVVIYPLLSICQLVLVEVSSNPILTYEKRVTTAYYGEAKPSASRLYTDPVLRSAENLDALGQEEEARLIADYFTQQQRDIQGMTTEGKQPDQPPTTTTHIHMGAGSSYVYSITDSEVSIKTRVAQLETTPGSEQFRAAVQAILEQVKVHEAALGEVQARDSLDQISEITNQASLEPAKRLPVGAIKGMITGLGATLSVVREIKPTWQQWGPVITSYFGGGS